MRSMKGTIMGNKAFGALTQGDRFYMTISATSVVVVVEVDNAPVLRPDRKHLMLRGHDVQTGKSLNAFGKPGAHDQRKLATN